MESEKEHYVCCVELQLAESSSDAATEMKYDFILHVITNQ